MISATVFFAIAGGLLGAALGSYLGMASWRIPRKLPLSGRSVCPGCGQPVPGYLNLPLLGFLILRGRAACCGAKLSPRYIALELATAAIGALAGALFQIWGLLGIALLVILGSLLVKLVIDRSTKG